MLKFETYKMYLYKIQHAKIESDPRADTMISRIDGGWTVWYNLLKTVDRTWRLCPAFISTTYSGNVARGNTVPRVSRETYCRIINPDHVGNFISCHWDAVFCLMYSNQFLIYFSLSMEYFPELFFNSQAT